MWCRSVAIVRTSKEDILAYYWHEEAQCRFDEHVVERKVLSFKSDHNHVTYQREKGRIGGVDTRDRESVQRAVWKETDEDQILVVSVPATDEVGREREDRHNKKLHFMDQLFKPRTSWAGTIAGSTRGGGTSQRSPQKLVNVTNREVVRRKLKAVLVIDEIMEDVCRVTYVAQLENEGLLGFTSHYSHYSLRFAMHIEHNFQNVRRRFELDEDDGEEIGEMLMVKREHLGGSARVRLVLKAHEGMKECMREHLFFEPMMCSVIDNSLGVPAAVSAQLCNLTKSNGKIIGRAFAIKLAANLTHTAAVDDWILTYPALQEFDDDEPWFRSMMEVVGKRLLGEVAWGVKFRVFTGAGLSILDITTDVTVILSYFDDAKEHPEGDGLGFGVVMLSFVCLSILLQLLLVYVQHGGRTDHFIRDALWVVSGLKPGVDGKSSAERDRATPRSRCDRFTASLYLCSCWFVCSL